VEWKSPSENRRLAGRNDTRVRPNLLFEDASSGAQMSQPMLPTSMPSFQQPYGLAMTPFGYYTVTPNPPYANPGTLTDYGNAQNTTARGQNYNRSEFRHLNGHIQNPNLQTGYLASTHPRPLVSATQRLDPMQPPLNNQHGVGNMDANNRIAWQLACERSSHDSVQLVANQYGPQIVMGPVAGHPAPLSQSWPVNAAHDSRNGNFDATLANVASTIGDAHLAR
jgi:hypothetical protein